jgi:hypothetical protein
LVIAGIASAHADDQPKRVLFISSYHPAFPPFDWQVNGLRTALQERGFGARRAIVDVEFMDTKRFPKSTQIPKFRVSLAAKLAQLPKYDVIISATITHLTSRSTNRRGCSTAGRSYFSA